MEPKLVLLLATRCLYLGALRDMGWWGGIHLAKQPKPHADDMSFWPAVVPLLTTRCLCGGGGSQGDQQGMWGALGGYIWQMKMVYCKVLLKTQDSLL